jgi:hypothetical protein
MSTSFGCQTVEPPARPAPRGGWGRDGDLGPAERGRTFDAAVLDGFEGTFVLNSKRLRRSPTPGIGIGQAGIDIALEGGKIDVKRIEGRVPGRALQRQPAASTRRRPGWR